jgi:YYY domain-containing protein
MPVSEILVILQWWLFLFLCSLVFLPITFTIFPSFVDKGYIFARSIGIALASYLMLLLGIAHILPFHRISTIFVLLLPLLLQLVIIAVRGTINEYLKTLIATITSKWKMFLFEETVFIVGLFFLSYIRSFSPDIHGLEKFMDYGFINSILRSTYFPPIDIWFPPLPINYYYFGHFVAAFLTKLSSIPANISYNLMLATVFSLCLVSAFSIGANLYHLLHNPVKHVTKKVFATGILSAILVTFAGNLHTIYTFFKPYPNEQPVPVWSLIFSPLSFPNEYWYPNATRFIYNTIHEFPMYSWVVADLHGHVSDIPFVLLTLATLLSIFFATPKTLKNHHKSFFDKYIGIIARLPIAWQKILLLSFLLAVMYMTNAWDGLIYFLLSLLVLLYYEYFHTNKKRLILLHMLLYGALLSVGFIAFIFPYSMFFKPFVSGIGVMCMPKVLTDIGKIGPLLFEANHCQHSPWWQLLTLHGFFYFFVFCFVFFITKVKKNEKSDIFVLLLMLISSLLIVLPEFIYAKDIYPAHFRANTMFKLVFQAFIMLSLASAYTIFRLGSTLRIMRFPFLILASVLFGLVMIYPFTAIKGYYGSLTEYKGLDGTAYLKNQYPADYEAIEWLNKEVSGQPVILEAQGDSYTDYARVSANTGIPTVLGWTVHEWLWRGSYDIPAPRITDIQTMYESADITQTRTLLKKYNVAYVFLGELERQKYPNLQKEKFDTLGEVVFHKGTTKIYQIKK